MGVTSCIVLRPHVKMKIGQALCLTLLSVVAASAQVIGTGKCPQPPVQDNFDVSQYLGKWYEIQKLPAVFQRGECSTANYSLNSPGVVGVVNSELLDDGTTNVIEGSARAKNASEPAKLEVTFFEDSPPGPYWVLSTDYTGHSVVFGCREFGPVNAQFAWILSREPTVDSATLERLRGVLSSAGVNVKKLLDTAQDEEYCSAMENWQ